jgi:asparagine synthase (glutamine-hydrolysing)
MCGICGALGFELSASLVRRMNRAMIHRGPDSEGILETPFISLGARRLNIIDLATGDQPQYNEDQSIAVVLNGEIYNYQELQQELARAGHHFTSKSDTEVIAHAYEQWGVTMFDHLRGMFAVALVDLRQDGNEKLLLARDRLGIKPLYIWKSKNKLMFASEVRALLASEAIPRQICLAGVYSYLAFASVQEPLTTIEGIESLPAASWLEITLTGGILKRACGVYWRPPAPSGDSVDPFEVRRWLLEAVSSHLVSDVPLGAFLSGGLDSGAIVALGSQSPLFTSDSGLRAFTLGFDDWPLDERSYAELTAKRWQVHQQVKVIRPNDLLTNLSSALRDMDQPTSDGINSWFVSREAKRSGISVALSGVGGDELFAGYPSFRQSPQLAGIPQQVGRVISRMTQVLHRPGGQGRLRKTAAYFLEDPLYPHPYFAVRGFFTSQEIKSLLLPSLLEESHNSPAAQVWQESIRDALAIASQYDSVGQISWLELSQYMRSTLLRDTDMMSMAHSLEVRVPLIDHELVEHILPLPGWVKLSGGGQKPLLSKAIQNDLPSEILQGLKRTFTLPFETWLRQGLASEVSQRLAAPQRLGDWFDLEQISRIWLDFSDGNTGWARPWALYVLDRWLTQNL